MTLRLIFMGTPDFAVPILDAVHEAGHHIAAVYSQPPRHAGRGLAEVQSPVQRRAEALGCEVFTPVNFKGLEDQARFASHGADVAVVVAYGLLLPENVLNATRLGCFNVHASMLPRWRGAAPIQRAIMAGDTKTAVAIMRMEKGLDTGPVAMMREIEIPPGTTAGALHDRLSTLGAALMVDALEALQAEKLTLTPQSADGITYAAKIDKREAHMDFTMPARDIVNLVHGLSPFPGAWFEAGEAGKTERIKVLGAEAVPLAADDRSRPGTVLDTTPAIATSDGAVRLGIVQRAGKKPVTANEFLRGFKLVPGTIVA